MIDYAIHDNGIKDFIYEFQKIYRGKMKKFLIIISPLCAVLLALMWFSWGLKGALSFFSAVFFVVAVTILLIKWMEFVDKHIKD